MRGGRPVLLFLSGLLCLAVLYAPLLTAGWATAIAIEALSCGQVSLGLSSLLVAAGGGMIWLLPVLVWYLVPFLRRIRRSDVRLYCTRSEEMRGTL